LLLQWCGHCKSLAPEWEKASKAIHGLVKMGTVDATVQTQLAGDFKISGYPTIMVFPAGKKT
jgi:protein disulfide-isomerase A6